LGKQRPLFAAAVYHQWRISHRHRHAHGGNRQSFGDNGRTDLRVGLDRDISTVRPLQTSNPGRIFENLIIIPLPAGGTGYKAIGEDVHAYDVRTGKLA